MIAATRLEELLRIIQGAAKSQGEMLTKLLEIEVLKELEDGGYLLDIGGKHLRALSSYRLRPHARYLAQVRFGQKGLPILSNLIRLPKMLSHLAHLSGDDLVPSSAKLARVLTKEGLESFYSTLLEELASAPSRERFVALMQLLLSLQEHILTIPLMLKERYALLQLRRKREKKAKAGVLEFYAFFPSLGALEGSVSMQGVRLFVDSEATLTLLMRRSGSFGYRLLIEQKGAIEPLFEPKTTQLLDIHI